MGTWVVDYGGGERDEEIANLVAKAQAGWVDIAVVGNEEISGGRETVPSMIALVQRVQADLDAVGKGNIPVTIAEPFELLFDRDGTPRYPDLIAAVDEVLFVNMHPFHDPFDEGISIDNAVVTLADWYDGATSHVPGKAIVVSETGWPSDWNVTDKPPGWPAVPSCENAARYLAECLAWAGSSDVDVFYFGAFDENWKGPELFEKRWGVWYADGSLKIPEPCSLGLLAIGTVGLLSRRRP